MSVPSPPCILSRLAATAACTLSLQESPGRSLLSRALPSLVMLETTARKEVREPIFNGLSAIVSALVPGVVTAIVSFAPLLQTPHADAPDEFNSTSSHPTVWEPCYCHTKLWGRASKVLGFQPWFRDANSRVSSARLSGRPCLIICDDIDLLDDFPAAAAHSKAMGDSDTKSPLSPQAALALLFSMWVCPECRPVAEDDHDDDDDDGEHAAPPAPMSASANVFIVATAISSSYMNQKIFSFPATTAVGIPSLLHGQDAAAWAAERFPVTPPREAGRLPPEALPLAFTVSKPPFRVAVAQQVTEALQKAELAGAGDRGASFDDTDDDDDSGGIAAEGQLLHAWAAFDLVVHVPPDASILFKGVPAPASTPASGSAPAPSPPSFFDKAFSSERSVSFSALKAEIKAAVVLPMLAWSYLRDMATKSGPSRAVVAEDESVVRMAEAMTTMRVKPPSGILLYGSSGSVDKGLLGKGIAQAARMRFIAVDAALILSKFVGDSEASIREIFRAARGASPCCVVIHNMEIIGGSRTGMAAGGAGDASGGGAASIHDRMLATLLTEMDGVGVKTSEGFSMAAASAGSTGKPGGSVLPADVDAPVVLVIGITERKEAIDAALLRPGRLDRHFLCG